MKGKLVKVDPNIVVQNDEHLDSLLKPLSEEIYLFTSKIGSFYRLKDTRALDNLKVNDELFFEFEQSKYEENLIKITNAKKESVGYILEEDTVIFARLMKAGKRLAARVKDINKSKATPLINIDIFLIDF